MSTLIIGVDHGGPATVLIEHRTETRLRSRIDREGARRVVVDQVDVAVLLDPADPTPHDRTAERATRGPS